MYSKHLISVTALLLSTVACSSATPDDEAGGTSGTGASGGQTGTGGSQPNGGGSGGTTGTVGGSGGSGGTGAVGGSVGSGGSTPGSGGSAGRASAGTGGTGSGATGGTGAVGTGGASAAGGASATGGTGGSTGGGFGTGGAAGAGVGGTSSAGSPGAGGSATGGMPSTGGSGGTGGGTAVKCDNLSLAPSKTGVAQPTGAAGGLKVLDWAGFTGAVSFTFDDNTPSQIPDYAQLKATGAHFTWFVVGSWLNGGSLVASYKQTIADGQELANHTYSHMSTGSQSDLQQNETFITQNFGVTANTMAAPNCDASWSTVAPNVLFQNRGPCSNNAATVSPRDSTSPFLLPAWLPNQGQDSATMSAAITTGKWRIFVIHGFDSQGGTYQPVPIGNVTATMSKAVSDGFWPETISNVGAYWQGQKLISATATTSATWTVPAHFPANMCVRITTTGGTVTQNGQAVPWDTHGYYQISLNAGSVTIQ